MTKYVKKPIPVDAWQIDLDSDKPDWVREALHNHDISMPMIRTPPYYEVTIKTLEGTMTASAGDYLIKGPKGEYWFNKKDIFEEMYEECEDEYKSNSIEVDDIVDLPDGSAIITFSMDEKTMKFFAQEGVKRVLVEVANKVIEENDQAGGFFAISNPLMIYRTYLLHLEVCPSPNAVLDTSQRG